MPATFQGSSFLITFPRQSFDLANYVEYVSSLPGFSYVCVSSEQHEDGSPHRHALLYFSKKIRVGARYFDYQEAHPNVQTVGRKKEDWKRVRDYVTKDGVFLEHGLGRHEEDSSTWSRVLAASSRVDAEKIIAEEKPRDWILNRRNIDYSLDQVCLTHFYK